MQPDETQVVVLMGGLGTRLGQLTADNPKPLMDIHGKPFFEYEFELLLSFGFKRFVFLIGYRAEMIEEYFGDGLRYGSDVSIVYSYDGEKLLGTGGAVVRALPLLEESFLLIYGDSFMDVDYSEILGRYFEGKTSNKKGLMTVLRNNNQFDSSNVLMKNGEIISYQKGVDDSTFEYIDYGIEVFSREIFELLPAETKIDLSVIQAELVSRKEMGVCEVFNRFYEIGTPSALEEFRNYAWNRFLTKHKAIFLDRDGVINEICFNEETEQLDSPLQVSELVIISGAIEAIRSLNNAGYYVFVVTNQPAASKGKVSLSGLYDINHVLIKELSEEGCSISAVAMCTHHPKGNGMTKYPFLIRNCECRKPKTGLINRITKVYNIDIQDSWMVGDSFTDIQAGKNAGLLTAFLGDFKCDVCSRLEHNKPDIIAKNLLSAAEQIIKRSIVNE